VCCNHISNDHPQEDLAKFGYKSESKVNFKKIKKSSYIFWLPIQVSTLYDDFRNFFALNLTILPVFSQKLLYMSHIGFFLRHHVGGQSFWPQKKCHSFQIITSSFLCDLPQTPETKP
jgi:hypothetical protein